MITQDNYKIEIYAATSGTNAELGLLDGVYTWEVGGDMLTDKGIRNPKRSVDLRTGGGKSQETATSCTIVGGKYSLIMGEAPIVSKRIKVYRNDIEQYTGAVTSVDVKGYESIVNINIESVIREVTLPYERGAIGDVVIDGTVTGDSGYIETLGEPAAMVIDSATDNTTYYSMGIKGGTQTNRDEIARIIDDIDARLASGENVYFIGDNGTYKLIVRTASGTAGVYPYRVGDGVNFSVLQDDVSSFGAILWSNEIFNAGLDGGIIVDGKEIDDVNSNIFPYGDGSVIDASEGLLWRSMTNGEDYDVSIETTAGNSALTSEWVNSQFYDGVYFQSFQGGNPNYADTGVTGNVADVTDKIGASSITAEVDYTPLSQSDISVACGLKFTMNGYLFKAKKLYAVVDFDGYFQPHTKLWIQAWVTSKENGTDITTGTFGREVDNQGIEAPAGTFGYISTPITYDNSDRKDFYLPAVRGKSDSQYVIDISGFMFDPSGGNYYDGVELYIALSLSEEGASTARNGRSVTIRQCNLVEGYEVGREGLKDSSVEINNASTNGTIPLAYEDVVKRQNLFGINSIVPTEGWGTEQVEFDGNGTAIDSNYLMDNIPSGNLEGVMGTDVTTTQLKTEIARSVPAVTFYNKDGVETLLELGNFTNNTNYIRLTDVVGDVTVKSYEGRYIQPSLSFEFGTDKKTLKVTNVEQAVYDSSYVVETIGLSSGQKEALWDAGHAIYERSGLTTSQTVRKYPIVNDAAGAYRIAIALYSNMGYVGGEYFNRQTASFSTTKSIELDIGDAVNIDMPQVSGLGVVTSVELGVYRGTNAYIIDMIEAESVVVSGDIFETGTQADDVLETGSQTNDILEDGV